jgi:hypothetical protein
LACEEYVICGKKQVPPVEVSIRYTTEVVCFQELLKRLQDRHGECSQPVTKAEKAAADAPNVMQVMSVVAPPP